MGRDAIKASQNIYFQCRMDAAKYNDALSSRERASEMLGVSPSSLANYELGITKVIPQDVIIRMADLYNAPQLENNYCLNECILGKCHHISDEVVSVDRVTVKLIKRLSVDRLEEVKEKLLSIAEDGVIDEDEIGELEGVLEYLGEVSKTVSELKIICDKVNGEMKYGKKKRD